MTLDTWSETIAARWRFTQNTGITEEFRPCEQLVTFNTTRSLSLWISMRKFLKTLKKPLLIQVWRSG